MVALTQNRFCAQYSWFSHGWIQITQATSLLNANEASSIIDALLIPGCPVCGGYY